jgi:hypothetical protein
VANYIDGIVGGVYLKIFLRGSEGEGGGGWH